MLSRIILPNYWE